MPQAVTRWHACTFCVCAASEELAKTVKCPINGPNAHIGKVGVLLDEFLWHPFNEHNLAVSLRMLDALGNLLEAAASCWHQTRAPLCMVAAEAPHLG